MTSSNKPLLSLLTKTLQFVLETSNISARVSTCHNRHAKTHTHTFFLLLCSSFLPIGCHRPAVTIDFCLTSATDGTSRKLVHTGQKLTEFRHWFAFRSAAFAPPVMTRTPPRKRQKMQNLLVSRQKSDSSEGKAIKLLPAPEISYFTFWPANRAWGNPGNESGFVGKTLFVLEREIFELLVLLKGIL